MGLAAFSQENEEPKGDSTRFKVGDATIIIIDNVKDGEINFECKNMADSVKKEKDLHWEPFFDIGMNGYMVPDYETTMPSDLSLMELDYSRSWSIGFNSMLRGADIIKDRLYISPGIGINWNMYSFKNNVNMSTSNDSTAFELDTIVDYDKNKLRCTYIQVPLVMGMRLGSLDKPVGLEFGVIAAYNIGSRLKQKYTLDDNTHKRKIKDDFNINPFKVDAIARISFDNVGLFAKYSLTQMFENDKAPELNQFSVGITIGDF